MSTKTFKKILLTLSFFAGVSALAGEALTVKSNGRKPQQGLKYRQSGVPVFDFVQKQGTETVRVKVIPKLDIGAEKEISAANFNLILPEKKTFKNLNTTHLQPIPLLALPQNMIVTPVAPLKNIKSATAPVIVPAVNPLDIIPDPIINEPNPTLKKITEMKTDEFKMIQALIFLNFHKKYDLAMALFVELMDHPVYKDQAKFHYAETALGLKLYSEFREKMIQVTKESKDKILQRSAVEKLVQNIKHLEISDIALIEPLAKEYEIDTVNYTDYLLKKAKYASEKGNLGELEEALLMIPATAKEHLEGTLLKAVFYYRSGQVDSAVQELEMLWPLVEMKKSEQIRNLTALTLARLYFQKADYKTAYKYYLFVDKTSGQWLQSMVEQAWTQVLAGDNEGAAGNMFSLHTDYFKKAYAPDTYIVRTVGYLNLCQYGDGIHVLNDLNKKYKAIYERLNTYQKNQKDPLNYYDLVKSFLKNTTQQEVSSLPRSFVVELARHPNYIGAQKQINNYEDENSRFNKITIDLIRKEREARLAMLKSKSEHIQGQREKVKPEDLELLEKKAQAKAIEHFIYARARDGIKKMREAAITRITQEEDQVRLKAAKNLQARYAEFVTVLEQLVDQKDILSYEIYSGAGEHIRFQMAGGDIKANEKTPASINPGEKDSYRWKFKGEVWDDEIGHYRSSLKNVCPKDDVIKTQ